jgi:hypothetical protein
VKAFAECIGQTIRAAMFFDPQVSEKPGYSSSRVVDAPRINVSPTDYSVKAALMPRTAKTHKAYAMELEAQVKALEDRVRFLEKEVRDAKIVIEHFHSAFTGPQDAPTISVGTPRMRSGSVISASTECESNRTPVAVSRKLMEETLRLNKELTDKISELSKELQHSRAHIDYTEQKAQRLSAALTQSFENNFDLAVQYKQLLHSQGIYSPALLDATTAEWIAYQSNVELARVISAPFDATSSFDCKVLSRRASDMEYEERSESPPCSRRTSQQVIFGKRDSVKTPPTFM